MRNYPSKKKCTKGVDNQPPMCYNLIIKGKELMTMYCLKCENYWKSDIDETKCEKCGTVAEEKKEEQNNG